MSGPLKVRIHFRIPRPKAHFVGGKPENQKLKEGAPEFPTALRIGDLDNFSKAVLDALNGIAYDDDSQIVDLRATKSYVLDPALGGAVVNIYSHVR